jgi:putative chitinase
MITAAQISASTGASLPVAASFLKALSDAMAEFEIKTPARQAAFLAQIGHESGGLRWLTEIWGPTLAQSRYEGRKDLGNTQSGDGFKFRGRGLLQTTGRHNYSKTGAALGVDLVANPAKLAEPILAARSAAWFWKSHGLNEIADAGDFLAITKRINGGTNGLKERQALFAKAKAALNG